MTGDGTVVTACAREEQIARHDHTLAQRLRDGNNIAHVAVPAAEPPNIDDTTLSRLAGLFVSAHAGRAIVYKDAPGRGTKRRRDGEEVRPDGNRDCVACGDSKAFFDLLSVACGHEYCGACLTELFEKSYKDESMFPPRCCRQTISVAGQDVKPFLSKDLRDKYEPRRVEIATKDRTYCFKKTCSTFIPPTAVQNKFAICSKCTCRTCADCKRAAHLGICAEDQDEQLTIDLARQEGWQRCSSCRRLVELTLGCYHMT